MAEIVTFETLSDLSPTFARLFKGTHRTLLLTSDEALYFRDTWPCGTVKFGGTVPTQRITLIPTPTRVHLCHWYGDDSITVLTLTNAEADQIKQELRNYPTK